jgi:hypothetical protein
MENGDSESQLWQQQMGNSDSETSANPPGHQTTRFDQFGSK